MASILDFLITSKASALFAKVSEKTGETSENIEVVFGAVLPLILGAIQQKIRKEEDLKKLVAALENPSFDQGFLTDLKKIELKEYSSAGKDFLQQIIGPQEKFFQNLSEVLDVKEISVTFISQTAAGILLHITSLQYKTEKAKPSELEDIIRSQTGASSKYNHSLISVILDKSEEGNIIQNVEGRIIGGGQNDNDKDGGVLGGMLGGK